MAGVSSNLPVPPRQAPATNLETLNTATNEEEKKELSPEERKQASKQRRRELDRGYSRRKRQRRQAELDALQLSRDDVVAQNQRLHAEYTRLGELWNGACRVLLDHNLALPSYPKLPPLPSASPPLASVSR